VWSTCPAFSSAARFYFKSPLIVSEARYYWITFSLHWKLHWGMTTSLHSSVIELTECTGDDQVQACCSCVQVSAWDTTVVSLQWARVHGRFRVPEMLSICFLTVAECSSYMAVHRRWSGLPDTWNSLPSHVTCTPSRSVFWGRLKAFFFRHSFPWMLPQLL